MARPRVIFFDVGNTLLFPNRKKMLAPIPDSRHPSLEQWQALERRTKKEFDENMQSGGVDHGFWWMFHTHLLHDLAADYASHVHLLEAADAREALLRELVRNTQKSTNWDQILPGTRDALERIGRNFRIAVISNADGTIKQALSHCGIAECFESITDSGIVGLEKPRREIFEIALASMQARAEESLYVGDVYSVDYLGARNAGMQAVLMDVAGAYRDRAKHDRGNDDRDHDDGELARVESMEQLEIWLRDQAK
jgi:putative hydrolase of the HAD superfamily